MSDHTNLLLVAPDAVLAFWFGDATAPRAQWFRKDDAFDASIRARFGATIDAAIDGRVDGWHTIGEREALARIVVLDQFTRNVFRGQGRAFAGDAKALAASHDLIRAGRDLALAPLQRVFAYLPLEHSESLDDQRECVARFEALGRENAALADYVTYARKHLEIVERFGRFPHRNAALGRRSTPDEVEFLEQPGSSF
jgi:uncharacterized protein (DUF924 family)